MTLTWKSPEWFFPRSGFFQFIYGMFFSSFSMLLLLLSLQPLLFFNNNNEPYRHYNSEKEVFCFNFSHQKLEIVNNNCRNSFFYLQIYEKNANNGERQMLFLLH